MTRSSRAVFPVAFMIVGALLPHEAKSQSWGVSVGPSHVFQDKWALGYRLEGKTYWRRGVHMQYGGEGAASFWQPAPETPDGLIGAEWKSSGSAWLFEAGPTVRLMIGVPEAVARLFLQGGAGAVIVLSNARITAFPVVPNPIGIPVKMMGSQVAPYMDIGLGILGRRRMPRIEVAVKAHALFVNPGATAFVTMEFGLDF